MASSLIVRGRSDLVPPSRVGRAAQYVRMSTDHQRYSTQNQAAAIAVYAAQHNLTIVRTYADEGKSGVVITRRDGLIETSDARADDPKFVLVLFDGARGIERTVKELQGLDHFAPMNLQLFERVSVSEPDVIIDDLGYSRTH